MILISLETVAVAQPSGQPIPDSLSPTKTSTTLTDATKCTGDSVRTDPPIPNYPTHIRNVVWRNLRAMCAQATALKVSSAPNPTSPAHPNSPSQSVVH